MTKELSESFIHHKPLKYETASTWTLIKELYGNSIPISIDYLASFGSKVLSLHFLRNLEDSNLIAAAGLANSVINLIAISIFFSLSMGMLSKVSHAYGAQNYKLIGYTLHRTLIINMLLCIPFGFSFYFMDQVLQLIGVDPIIAGYVQQICAYSFPGCVASAFTSSFGQYLAGCEIFTVPSFIEVTGGLVNIGASYLTIVYLDMGIIGIGISFSAQQILCVLLYLIYFAFKEPVKGSLFWLNKKSFEKLWELFVYEVLVGSMLLFDWVFWEFAFMCASLLNPKQLAAYTIVLNNLLFLYIPLYSLGDSCNVMVGNSMGSRNPKLAKKYLKSAFLGLVSFMGISVAVIGFFSKDIGRFYTNDEDVISYIDNLSPYYMIFIGIEYIQILLGSMMGAIGKEGIASKVQILCYYLFGAPVIWALCFKLDLQLEGLAMGQIAVSAAVGLGNIVIVCFKTNWEEQSKLISEKIANDKSISSIIKGKSVFETSKRGDASNSEFSNIMNASDTPFRLNLSS